MVKGVKTIQWGKKKVSSTNAAGRSGQLHEKEWIITSHFTPYFLKKKKSKQIKHLNVKAKTIKTMKFLEENTGINSLWPWI